MDRFDDPWRGMSVLPGNGPGRGVRVVLAWQEARPDREDAWDAASYGDVSGHLLSATSTSEFWSRRDPGPTALAPSKGVRPAASLDAEFDPRLLVKHPVTVLDLGRGGVHLIARVRPKRDRDHWIGIEENGAFAWSKVVLRSLSEPTVGAFLARFSFVGSCPYELIRRAIIGRPPASKHDGEPGRP